MLLTINTSHQPGSDLGFLLHKHPDRFQSVQLSLGKAHIFFPECEQDHASIALLLDLDPVEMVKGARASSSKDFSLGQYVNDRPYVASSLMSTALSKAFSTAMNGKCTAKPELAELRIPLKATIASLPAPSGGELLIRKLFEPLGYAVSVQRQTLDEKFSSWGDSKYFTVSLSHSLMIKELLSHLYVLIPVLDNDKHYYVSQAEIEKLLERGKGWLESHPEKEQITKRYLLNLKSLSQQALERLSEGEKQAEEEATANKAEQERKKRLHDERLEQVAKEIKAAGAETVIDLGCGEGKLIRLLLKEKGIKQIAGMDVSYQELLKAKGKLHWDDMAPKQKARLTLFQGSLTYQDERLKGFDAAALVEVIEHLDPNRLASLQKVVFAVAKPKTVIVTTPNAEYNVLFEQMADGAMRHTDHRFEWSRQEFKQWASNVAEEYGYTVEIKPVGPEQENIGAPSQMGIFTYEA